ASLGDDRGNADYASPAALAHARDGGPHAVEGAAQVDRQHRLPGGRVGAAHQAVDVDPGVVDQDVDRAELGGGAGEQRLDLVHAAHVGRQENGSPSESAQFAHDVARDPLVPRDVVDHQISPTAGQLQRRGATQAAPTAG